MKVLLIGCGSLGNMLLKKWCEEEWIKKILVVQPSLSQEQYFLSNQNVQFVNEIAKVPEGFKPDIAVLALKPQQLKEVHAQLLAVAAGSLIISLLTGVDVQSLSLSGEVTYKIVRLMPNVAMALGESVNLAYASVGVGTAEQKILDSFFAMTGKLLWLPIEGLIDTLTPFSGSGPAYFFLLAEILKQILLKIGIEKALAHSLIQQTLIGSAAVAKGGENFQSLIESVVSKGGITEAALAILEPRLQEAMAEAISAAANKLKGLK